MQFRDRHEAGVLLGRRLEALLNSEATSHSSPDTPVVLGLPRGGVVVAAEVAKALQAALDIVIVRKLGAPWQPELALGALALIGDRVEIVYNNDTIDALGVGRDYLQAEIDSQAMEARRRADLYHTARQPLDLCDRVVVLVDDGIATGASVRAALHAIRMQRPRRLILAVPVAPPDVIEELSGDADRVICLSTPSMFMSVGNAYQNFEQTSDGEVISLLRAYSPPSIIDHD